MPVSRFGNNYSLEDAVDEDSIERRTLDLLANALCSKRTIAFIGAGVSQSYGFPNWKKFVKDLRRDILSHIEIFDSDKNALLNALKSEIDLYALKNSPSSLSITDRYLIQLEICDQLLRRINRSVQNTEEIKTIRTFASDLLRNITSDNEPGNAKPDTLNLLISKLNIKRFVTTNYDMNIEKAFANILRCPPLPLCLNQRSKQTTFEHNLFGEGPIAHSITLEPERPQELINFAVGAPGHDMGVFHAHGRVDEKSQALTDDPNLIITERDYQKLYLGDDGHHQLYRQTLDLLFSCNPFLFVGISMAEDDLLRPLRQFVASRHKNPQERPYFALMPRKGEKGGQQSKEYRRFLYERYGVKAIFYDKEADDNQDEDTKHRTALCNQLDKICHHTRTWSDSFQLKPQVRSAWFYENNRNSQTDSQKFMIHHGPDEPDSELAEAKMDHVLVTARNIIPDHIKQELQKVRKETKPSRTLLILGNPGTGKGTLGAQLAEQAQALGFDRGYFASAHFAADFSSAIEGAARYLAQQSKQNIEQPLALDPLESLCQQLLKPVTVTNRCIIVFGGLERLLLPYKTRNDDRDHQPNSNLKTMLQDNEFPFQRGTPVDYQARSFFERIIESGNKSNHMIVLTSSLLPHLNLNENANIKVLHGFRAEDLYKSFESSNQYAKAKTVLTRLTGTLRGHKYALAVIMSGLEEAGFPSDPTFIAAERLISELMPMSLPARIEHAVSRCIAGFPNDGPAHDPEDKFIINSLALFATPVQDKELAVTTRESLSVFSKKFDKLSKRRLIIRIRGTSSENEPRYTAHSVVRRILQRSLGAPDEFPAEPPLSVFNDTLSDVMQLQPAGGQVHSIVIRYIDQIFESLESREGRQLITDSASHQPLNDDSKRGLLRAAFGLLRANWTAAGIARSETFAQKPLASGLKIPHFDHYEYRLSKLLDLVMGDKDKLWEIVEAGNSTSRAACLYADELSWIYNELGQIALLKGELKGAYNFFRLQQDIALLSEQKFFGLRRRQAEINLAAVYLERGRLVECRYHLENALVTTQDWNDPILRAKAQGYLGLVEHLSGNLKVAENLYKVAIEKFYRIGNRRALSIFLRHRGDLKRWKGDYDGAGKLLRESLAAAESGRYLDLVHYTRLAMANVDRRTEHQTRKKTQQAGTEDTLEFARIVGLPKLAADSYRVQGLISLSDGDVNRANRLAMRCLSVSLANGMALRTTASLVFLGQVQVARGNQPIAEDIFKSAVKMARRQNYVLQTEKAERQLMSLV